MMASSSGSEMRAVDSTTRTGPPVLEKEHEKEDRSKDEQDHGDHDEENEQDGHVRKRKRMEVSLEADVGEVGWELVCQAAVDLRDVALDARMEVAKLKFELGEILKVQHMERCLMEVMIDWERAAIAGRGTPDAPFFNGCPLVLCNNLRVHELAMTRTYDRVMSYPPVNEHLLAILLEVSVNGVPEFKSEPLKRKWAQQLDEISACKVKKAELEGSMEEFLFPGGRHLRGAKLEHRDDEEDDGELCDLKRLDREILEHSQFKAAWIKSSKESYRWYYPYGELSSREVYLSKLVDWLSESARVRGTAAPTESEVIGYLLLELLATSALSPSISCAPFPPP